MALAGMMVMTHPTMAMMMNRMPVLVLNTSKRAGKTIRPARTLLVETTTRWCPFNRHYISGVKAVRVHVVEEGVVLS
jgi:hypothetical protein